MKLVSLVRLAHRLDALGLFREASVVDRVIERIAGLGEVVDVEDFSELSEKEKEIAEEVLE